METETRVDGLVARWEELRDRGTPVTIDELCAGCPELAPEVRHRVEALQAMDSALDTRKLEARSTVVGHDHPGGGGCRGRPEVARAEAVYRVRGRHDQGGLGVVFTAYQEELDRTVALKRIRPDRLRDRARRRFLREATLTARLQHPGIVPIYGLGQDDRGPFYTMPFIGGRTLQRAIADLHGDEGLRHDPGRWGLRLRGLLQPLVTACNTVAYAHDQGVVHRDLKPSNIMLGPYGETLVMDWGLAKRLGADEASSDDGGEALSPPPSGEEVTATGEVLGTPTYMSPEQARGEPAGPASDIFSLGLILYAILTGQSGLAASGPRRLDAAIAPPRRREPRVPRALEAICLKALAPCRRRPIRLGARHGRRRHAMAGRRAGVGLARAALDPCPEMGAAAPHERGRGDGGAGGRTDRAGDRGRPTGAGQRSAQGCPEAGQRREARTTEALAQSEESRKQAEAVTRFLVKAFRSPDPSQDGREMKVVNVLDRASERLAKEAAGSQATRGALLEALGQTY